MLLLCDFFVNELETVFFATVPDSVWIQPNGHFLMSNGHSDPTVKLLPLAKANEWAHKQTVHSFFLYCSREGLSKVCKNRCRLVPWWRQTNNDGLSRVCRTVELATVVFSTRSEASCLQPCLTSDAIQYVALPLVRHCSDTTQNTTVFLIVWLR